MKDVLKGFTDLFYVYAPRKKRRLNYVLLVPLALLVVSAGVMLFLGLVSDHTNTRSLASGTDSYTWSNVAIGGGGYVNGLVMHPLVKDLVYIRTDVGGMYRWDSANNQWIPLLDTTAYGDQNLMGVESIAIDPNNADVVYAARGETLSWPLDISKSTDRGQTWVRGTPDNAIQIQSNGKTSVAGERLAVDPNDGNIVYFSSRYGGLYKTTAAGAPNTWQKVTSFPTLGVADVGLSFVVFDKSSSTFGSPTNTMYVGAWGTGVYKSTDAGASWSLMSGSPLNPIRATMAANGTLYVTHSTGVSKLVSGAWNSITPASGRYCGISADPQDSNHLITGRCESTMNGPAYISTNGGSSWAQLQHTQQPSTTWLDPNFVFANTATLTFDLFIPNRVWMTDWYSVWRTDNITASPSTWSDLKKGHEETVPFGVVSFPSGAQLMTALADVKGFRHTSLTDYPAKQLGVSTSDLTSIDYADTNPTIVAAVGSQDTGTAGYKSNDNGQTWTSFSTKPFSTAHAGVVSVSATGDRIVWMPLQSKPYYSTDGGATWKVSSGISGGVLTDFWTFNGYPLASDRVNNLAFYYAENGNFYRSTDGAATFTQVSSLSGITNPIIKAAPGMEGEVWVAGSTGLYRSSNGGTSFTKLTAFQLANGFGFGKNAPGSTNPTVFVTGILAGDTYGVYRSDDLGGTWVKVSTPNIPIARASSIIEGDKQVYGRVYIGVDGRGIWVGTLQAGATPPITSDTATPAVNVSPTISSTPPLMPTATAFPSATPMPTSTPMLTPQPTATPVSIDTIPPTIKITNPLNSAIVKRNSLTTISVNATDNVGVTKVEFLINGSVVFTDTVAPYSYPWSVPARANTKYTLSARAYDAGGYTSSTSISVTSSK